jgi:adenosylhomocysteine nucleosidase
VSPSVERPRTVVILTALESEYKAVRAHVTEAKEQPHPRGTLFEVGRIDGVPWQVALVATGTGNRPAAVLAERAIATFDPVALLVVGIAGGLHDDIRLGDVVVSSWIYAYQGGCADEKGFHPFPRAWPGAHRMSEAAAAVGRMGDACGLPPVHMRPIAAGDVVLNSRETPLAKQLTTTYSDAAAVEMESAGVAEAAHLNDDLRLLTIRGISDLADGNKYADDDAGHQPVAAANAAAFAVALLRKLPAVLPPDSGTGAGAHAGAGANGAPKAKDAGPMGPISIQNIVGEPGATLNVVQGGNLYTGRADT